jgi:single-stranded-DNA-specific exonuclease
MNIQVNPATVVKKSLKNRVWQLPEVSEGNIHELVARGANALTAPILAARGMTADEVENFLSPTIRGLLPNPSFFKDMDIAADRIAKGIRNGEKIAIWSDYDVDGATSAGTMGRFLRDCGIDFDIYIPDRIEEGYGPNYKGLMGLQAMGNSLVIILDSGTTAFEPLEQATDAGLDIVVVDHHAAEDELPKAVAIVNPNRLDQEKGFGHLCAAGMTFVMCVALSMRLRKTYFFDGQDGRLASAPDLMSYLDLVALGTICDVVPLTTLNRAFVMKGLPVLSERNLPGVAALAQVAGCEDEINARDCGFGLGPRINAGGRIGASDAGTRLLLENDPGKALAMAEELNQLNGERQEMERSCTEQSLAQVPGDFIPGETREIAVAITDAHEGVVGISAARLKEALDAPAFVLAPTPEGELKGSGRSVPGFDLGAAIIKARKAGLITKGGGHAMAGGVSMRHDQVDDFIAFINVEINKSDYARTGVVSKADDSIPINKATIGMVDAAQSLAPFGMGNPTPRFVIPGIKVADVRVLKDKHIKLVFEHPDLGPAGPRIEGPIWNAVGTPFGDAVMALRGQVVDCLGALEKNEWQGRVRLQLKIEDLRPIA